MEIIDRVVSKKKKETVVWKQKQAKETPKMPIEVKESKPLKSILKKVVRPVGGREPSDQLLHILGGESTKNAKSTAPPLVIPIKKATKQKKVKANKAKTAQKAGNQNNQNSNDEQIEEDSEPEFISLNEMMPPIDSHKDEKPSRSSAVVPSYSFGLSNLEMLDETPEPRLSKPRQKSSSGSQHRPELLSVAVQDQGQGDRMEQEQLDGSLGDN